MMVGNRFSHAICAARAPFKSVISLVLPPLMVGTEAVIMHSTPLNHPDHIVSHMRDMALSRSLSLSFERERS